MFLFRSFSSSLFEDRALSRAKEKWVFSRDKSTNYHHTEKSRMAFSYTLPVSHQLQSLLVSSLLSRLLDSPSQMRSPLAISITINLMRQFVSIRTEEKIKRIFFLFEKKWLNFVAIVISRLDACASFCFTKFGESNSSCLHQKNENVWKFSHLFQTLFEMNGCKLTVLDKTRMLPVHMSSSLHSHSGWKTNRCTEPTGNTNKLVSMVLERRIMTFYDSSLITDRRCHTTEFANELFIFFPSVSSLPASLERLSLEICCRHVMIRMARSMHGAW